MPRNLDKRVEVLTPITVHEHQQRLDAVLAASLADDTRGWQLAADARWRRVGMDRGGDAQAYLYEMARQRSRRAAVP
jgi:polyphosphate kinase